MKKVLVVLAVLVLIVFSGYNSFAEDAKEVVFSEMYGVTTSGLFYAHKSLIEEVRGNTPRLRTSLTNWRDGKMEKRGDYFVYQADLKGKPFYDSFPQIFCFSVGGNRYIPHASIDARSQLIDFSDVVDNEHGGYNFKVDPVKDPPQSLR